MLSGCEVTSIQVDTNWSMRNNVNGFILNSLRKDTKQSKIKGIGMEYPPTNGISTWKCFNTLKCKEKYICTHMQPELIIDHSIIAISYR